MRLRHLLLPLLTCLALSAQAAEEAYYKFSDLLQRPSVKELMDPAITLHWAGHPAPGVAEMARPESLSRSAISRAMFGGSEKHCLEAFELVVDSLISKARERGYDIVMNIQAARDKKATADTQGFYCKPGFRTTEVALWSSFAMSAAAKQKADAAEKALANLPPRPPVEGAMYLPLEPILASPEGQAALAGVKAYVGSNAPKYTSRQGPEVYSENFSLDKITPEEACRKAVLKTLDEMSQWAKVRNYDSVIKIRSYQNRQFTPVATDVECLVGRSKAGVRLQASLAETRGAQEHE
ncbi:MAG: hypothetical protein ABW190_15475 [Rhizobacter sp.]